MARLTKPLVLIFVAATLIGICLHFVYALFPSPVTALFAPVNESIWEHVKLLYWPGLVAALLLSRGAAPGTLGTRSFALLLGAILMLLFGYLYHVTLGGTALIFDIVLYVLLMALTLFLPTWLNPARWEKAAPLLILLSIALGIFIVLFTFLPPASDLFIDLSRTNTWTTLPC